jgi:hypothetical protein
MPDKKTIKVGVLWNVTRDASSHFTSLRRPQTTLPSGSARSPVSIGIYSTLTPLNLLSARRRKETMARVPGVTKQDHPLNGPVSGGKPPAPPMPAKAKVKAKVKSRAKIRKALKKRGK